MAHRDTKLAEEMTAALRQVKRVQGVVYVDDFGAWLLSRPELSMERFRLEGLVTLLSQPLATQTPTTRSELATQLRSREVIELTPGFLGRIRYQMQRLGNCKRLSKLVKSGVQPAKSLQGTPWKETVKICEDRLAALEQGYFEKTGLWPHHDVEQIEALPALTQNLASVFGADAASRVGIAVASLEGPDHGRASMVLELAESFRSTVNRVARGDLGNGTDPLDEALTSLPVATHARINRFAGLMRSHLGVDGQLVPPNDELHLALGNVIQNNLPAAAKRLVLAVAENVSRIGPRSLAEVSDDVLCIAAAAQLAAGKFQIQFPPNQNETAIRTQSGLVCLIGNSALEAAWPEVVGCGRTIYYLPESFGALPGKAAARLIKDDIAWVADTLVAAQVRRYLIALDDLTANPIDGVDPKDPGFVSRFKGRTDWVAATVVGLPSGDMRAAEAVRALSAHKEGLWLAPLVKAFRAELPTERPAGFGDLALALNVTDHALDQYVFWREWSGQGATFSAALQKFLSLEEEEERQIRAIEHELSKGDAPELLRRVQTLKDSERRRIRKDNAQVRALKAYERSLVELRRQATSEYRSRFTRLALRRLLGKAIDHDAPDHIDQIPLLFGTSEVDMRLARRFVDDVVAGHNLQNRPLNQSWLGRMSGVFDTSVWTQGLDFEATIEGRKIHFKTESNPLHVLKMGTYFDTCLSLVEGFNAGSTLANAIDVNKAVIYGYDESGNVVARKLIAVTDSGNLLGYYTYAYQDREAVHRVLSSALKAWAKTCKLRLTTVGAPTSIHDAFWYDDGAESWAFHAVDKQLDPALDLSLGAELSYVAGFENRSSWQRCVQLQFWPWTGQAIAQLWALSPGKASESADENVVILARQNRFEDLFALDRSRFSIFRDCQNGMPADAAIINAFCEALVAAKRRDGEDIWPALDTISATFALADFRTLVGFLLALIVHANDASLECIVDDHHDCQRRFVCSAAAILQYAGVRDGFHGPSLKQLWNAKLPMAHTIALELAMLEPLPGLAKQLRAAHRTDPSPTLARALSLLSDRASSWTARNLDTSFAPEPNETLEVLYSSRDARPDYCRHQHPSYWFLMRRWLDTGKTRDPHDQELDTIPNLAGYQAFLSHLKPTLLYLALNQASIRLSPAEYEVLLAFAWEECRPTILDRSFGRRLESGIRDNAHSYRMQLAYLRWEIPKVVEIDSDRMRWLDSELQSQRVEER